MMSASQARVPRLEARGRFELRESRNKTVAKTSATASSSTQLKLDLETLRKAKVPDEVIKNGTLRLPFSSDARGRAKCVRLCASCESFWEHNNKFKKLKTNYKTKGERKNGSL